MIDLHLELVGSEASPQVAWDAMRRRRTWIELDGRRVPTLNTEALALHVALHAARHGAGTPQPMEDLIRAIERWPSDVWRGADQLARELQATPTFAAGLRQVPQGVELARRFRLPATDDLHGPSPIAANGRGARCTCRPSAKRRRCASGHLCCAALCSRSASGSRSSTRGRGSTAYAWSPVTPATSHARRFG